ncbi:MAG: RNA 3'-terminal phosphate cyclase [Acidobacteria bacterium]|nr:RNA 3'-terminal phosphate cyclase [Acidobacteriota bacterium]
MITIDGSFGEGGGQILRSALGLSLVTGKPFKIEKIRAGRKNPGLLRQHLTAVNAATQVGNAEAEGASLGSKTLVFQPGTVNPGNFRFAVGTAGSATLVLQTILPALLTVTERTELTLEGGTHNPFAPPFDFLSKAFLPRLNKMGPKVSVRLDRPGFYPAGGGKFHVTIEPSPDGLLGFHLPERGKVLNRRVKASVACLPPEIADRELTEISRKMSLEKHHLETEVFENSHGPGNVVTIEIESEHVTEVFTGFGEKGVRAESVADNAVKLVRRYLTSDVPVGEYLADQLLIPLALAGEGSFVTLPPSRHTTTNIEIIKLFLDVEITTSQLNKTAWEVRVAAK